MESIADELNRKHIDKNNKGFIWCKNTIKYLLKNEKYTGKSIFRKFYTTESFPFKQRKIMENWNNIWLKIQCRL